MKKNTIMLFFLIMCLGLYSQELPAKITVVRDCVDYPPLEFHQNGLLTGFHIEVVNEVAASLGIKIEWYEVPWSRAMKMIELGEANAISYIRKTSEREKWSLFNPNNTLSSSTFCFIIKKEMVEKIKFTGNITEILYGRILLVIRDFSLPESITNENPKTEIAPDMLKLLGMLEGNRADLAIINKNDYVAAFKGKPEEALFIMLEPSIKGSENYIAFSKTQYNAIISEKFGKAMRAFKKTDRYAELKKKYKQ